MKGKTYNLCTKCEACPIIEVGETEILIGEKENICHLTIKEFNTLKELIIDKII